MQGKLLIEPFYCIFIVEEFFFWTAICKNKRALLSFLKGQDVSYLNVNIAMQSAFNNRSVNNSKTSNVFF